MIGGEIACIFSVTYSDKVSWRHYDTNDAIYLHRIVVNPKFKGQNQFGKVLKWSLDHQKELAKTHLRMDTWGDNPTLIDYYKSFGFKEVEYFRNPDTEALPIQQRGNLIVLLQYDKTGIRLT